MTPRYPREMLNNPGFVVCPGADMMPITETTIGHKDDGKIALVEIIVCSACGRTFGSMDYFESHGTFKRRKEGDA